LPERNIAVKAHPQKHNAVQVALPLGEIIPRVNVNRLEGC
jgi:hypothetical protein